MSETSAYAKALRIGFIALAICLLSWWVIRLDGNYDNEDYLLFEVVLSVVGFPAAAIALVGISLIDLVVPIFVAHTRLIAVVIWLILASISYLQWFIWMPKLVTRLRAWQRS